MNFNLGNAFKDKIDQLHEIEELRLQVYESSILYKEKLKKWNDTKILH